MKLSKSLGRRAMALALGSAILLPGMSAFAATSYTATDNDTFWKLSQRFCVPLQKLMLANPAVDPLNIYAGLKLNIPDPVAALEKSTAAAAPAAIHTLASKEMTAKAIPAKTTAVKLTAVKPTAAKTAAKKAAASAAASKAKSTVAAKPAKTVRKKAANSSSAAAKAKPDSARSVAAKSVRTASGSILTYSKVFDMKATAYSDAPEENGWGPVDYFGNPLKLGTIAVDPNVIPLGTKVYVTGYDFDGLPVHGMIATATDTGSAIVGNRIDIFVPASPERVSEFGFQQVKLYVID